MLERGRIAERWRSERWDGLRFQSPNALVRLPDFPFRASDPDAFATRDEILDFITAYAAHIAAPVRCGVEVRALRDGGPGFVVETSHGPIGAKRVVVATGPYQRKIIPAMAAGMPDMLQLHACAYRAPEQLPAGAVLVVGSGASGSQIAEELMLAGRQVYLCISRHRRAPRRYRGRDHIWWWVETGLDRTPVRGPDWWPLVHSGAYGGRTIDFRDFAQQGMVLLGRAESVRDGVITFGSDLADNLAHGDAAYLAFLDFVDAHVRESGLDAPEDPDARIMTPTPTSMAQSLQQLDLSAAGVTTVIWATGYGLDFGWIDLPVVDERGLPIHRGGVSETSGLYFLGLPFLSKATSSFLFGVGDDAERIAEHMVAADAPGADAAVSP